MMIRFEIYVTNQNVAYIQYTWQIWTVARNLFQWIFPDFNTFHTANADEYFNLVHDCPTHKFDLKHFLNRYR